MSEAILGHDWPAVRGPVLRLVTGLGDAPAQQVIDPYQTSSTGFDGAHPGQQD